MRAEETVIIGNYTERAEQGKDNDDADDDRRDQTLFGFVFLGLILFVKGVGVERIEEAVFVLLGLRFRLDGFS